VIYVSTDVPESGRLTAVIAHPFFCGTMAAEVLAGCLKKRGKVAILSGSLENLNHTEKIRGFRSMIAQLDPTSSVVEVVETRDDPKEAYRAIRRLMRAASPGIDGLYVTSANSIPALEALRDLGRLEQCAIVTTDLFPELVSFIREGIVRATVYQCPEVQGKIAIRAMYEYLMEKIMPPPSIGVTPQLVMRSNLDLYVRDSGQLSNTPLPI
jgi:LacI family transcriptional regulator